MKQPIPPDSLRGRLVVAVEQVITEFAQHPDLMRTEAMKQRLTKRQLLAALITERVLEFIPGEG